MSLRYVVLHHTQIDAPHFDFLFEMDAGEPLMSLRCPTWPPAVGDRWEELSPHRQAYLDYEGPVSNDRGRVDRVEAGTISTHVLLEEPLTVGMRMGSRRELSIARHPDGNRDDLWIVLTCITLDEISE